MVDEKDKETRVDLGDDLLDKTVELTVGGSPEMVSREPERESARDLALPATPAEIDDKVQSAKILMNEGLHDEAKKTLHHVLVVDSRNGPAKALLAEIHEAELKQIFAGETRPKRSFRRKNEEASLPELSSEEIIRDLDRDLKLDFFSEEGVENKLTELSLFKDSGGIEAFAQRFDKEIKGLSVSDRTDLGIGFLEMGLFPLAIHQFKGAIRMLQSISDSNPDSLISTASLLAQAFLLSGQAFEATELLQPLVMDRDVSPSHRAELFYMMGRSYELLKDVHLARSWYQQVVDLDPMYRDARERQLRL